MVTRARAALLAPNPSRQVLKNPGFLLDDKRFYNVALSETTKPGDTDAALEILLDFPRIILKPFQ